MLLVVLVVVGVVVRRCLRIRVFASPPLSDQLMSQLNNLKSAVSLKDIADLLEVKVAMLSFILYKKPKATLYSKFDIPKRHGGIREISAPEQHLKLIQHRLAKLLQDCVDEINELDGKENDSDRLGVAHGFKRKRTIMTNARAHITRRYVFNVDLHDFFGTINFGRVRGFFLKEKHFLLNPIVATVLAQIACHENKLPQGSPCSPVISNLIGHALDMLLVRLAHNSGCTYTRYADDLTFSTNKYSFPARIAVELDGKGDEWIAGHGLERLIARSGFSLNEKKTRMQYKDSRQEVTGLCVNRKINVTATYRYRVRAMVDSLLKTGGFEFIYKTQDALGHEVINSSVGRNQQLMGMLAHIDCVDLFNRKLCEVNNTTPTETPGRLTLFRRFLYFDAFYASSMPVVVCEGKTDNTYLRCAIKSLASLYPSLVIAGPNQKLAIRLFKYSESRTSRITELTGGVGGLCKFIKNYHNDLKEKFRAPSPMHPVILLIDSDNGAHSVYGAIAGVTNKKKPSGSESFIHVVGNLYVVPTPLTKDSTSTTIENFFHDTLLKTVLNEKTFNPKDDKNNEKNYGKAAFARDVVARNAATIDFSAFSEILNRINSVLADYAVKKTTLAVP